MQNQRTMDKMQNNSVIISKDFKKQLITGILSAPIVYIPHYHFNYIDIALAELLPRNQESCEGQDKKNLLGLYRETIYEYDQSRGRIDFESKRPISTEISIQISSVLKNLLIRNEKDSECPVVLNGCKIVLLKNIGQLLFKDQSIQLMLQTFAEKYERGDYDERTTIIIASPLPVNMLPMELLDIVSVINILPPSIDDIEECVKNLVMSEHFKIKQGTLIPDLCRTLQGLSFFDIQQILRSVLIRTGNRLTEKSKILALEEKKKIVKKSGVIEVIDSDIKFEDVGGLKVLQDDMKQKAVVFKHLRRATDKDVNLQIPKGILIVGMPGCGKSMIAKSIAHEFEVSLLRLDISNLMGQYVGQSEENLRRALATAEAAHPCVLWIDEIEKAFHGANSSNNNENDTLVMRMMGYFLTWMQERKTAVYIVATANDVMRPEFMRKGRFDEVYFVDFPSLEERKSIFEKKIRRFHNTPDHQTIFDFTAVLKSLHDIAKKAVADTTVKGHEGGFSGSEIDCVINTVVEKKFVEYSSAIDEERQIETPMKIKVSEVIGVIDEMKKHVMSSQVSESNKERNSNHPEYTQIENIYRMHKTYKFKPASE